MERAERTSENNDVGEGVGVAPALGAADAVAPILQSLIQSSATANGAQQRAGANPATVGQPVNIAKRALPKFYEHAESRAYEGLGWICPNGHVVFDQANGQEESHVLTKTDPRKVLCLLNGELVSTEVVGE
ncbi:MAG: hypothetical protein IIC33_10080 [Chloroflexi bacterium]|nr:hypothetical protein [Chloroflexota bacterium]